MTKTLLFRGTVIAAASAVAIMLAVAGDATAQTKKAAAKAAPPPPPAPGFCTASVNAFKWGHLGWRTSTGHVIPTVGMCYDAHCPAQC